jgi:peptidoglycan hydrolase-like protein with peptidoglycan-binding domain
MKQKTLAAISGFAFAGSLMVSVPIGWAQSGTSPSSGANEGSMQSPSDRSGNQGSRSTGKMRKQQLSTEQAKEVQEALKEKGFDPGTADGVIGAKTHQAIRDFQKANNMQVTGRLDEKTASALGVEASDMNTPRGGSKSSSGMGRSGQSNIPGSPGSSVDQPSKATGRE